MARRRLKRRLSSLKKKLLIFVCFCLWSGLAALVLLVAPENWLIISAFFCLLFLSLLVTFSLFFERRVLILLTTTYLISSLLLFLVDQGHWLNLALLTGFFLVLYREFVAGRHH